MIGFHSTDSMDRYLRLEDIAGFGARKHSMHPKVLHAKLQNGDTVEVSYQERASILRRPVQLIPAEAGLSIVTAGADVVDGSPWMDIEPLIAWALCLDGEVRAVGPDGVSCDDERATYVKFPDGTVRGIGQWSDPCRFKTVEEMRDHFAAQERKARADG